MHIRQWALFASLIITVSAQAQTHIANRWECAHTQHTTDQRMALTEEDDSGFDVKWYFLDLEATNINTVLAGSATVLVEVTEAIDEVALDLHHDYEVSSITVNDQEAVFTHNGDALRILLAPVQEAGTLLECTIHYSGQAELGTGFFRGISHAQSGRWGVDVTYTLSEPLNAYHWFPAKQVLTDKADSVRIHVTTPSHLKVGSNGLLEATVALDDDRVRHEWASHYPTAYYLLAMTIGPFQEHNFSIARAGEDSLWVQNYLYDVAGVTEEFGPVLDQLPAMLTGLEAKLGPYPFAEEKYGHVMAPFGGGMEHQTMSSMGYFSFTLMAHELGHQWFGDYVTCGTWQDIWVNEGFARYTEYLAIEQAYGRAEAENWRQGDVEGILEEPDGSVFVPESSATNESRIFSSRLSYAKGGQLLHMVRHEVNHDSLFFASLRTFADNHAMATAIGDDFLAALETTTGEDYAAMFNPWYYGEGHPIYDLTWEQADNTLYLRVNQTGSTSASPFFVHTLPLVIDYTDGTKDTVRVLHTETGQQFSIPLSGTVRNLQFDPENWILKEVDNVREGGVVGLFPREAPQVIVYPQPTTQDFVYLEGPTDIERMLVNDLTGRQFSVPMEAIGNRWRLDIHHLPPGMYQVRLHTETGTHTLRLIKQ